MRPILTPTVSLVLSLFLHTGYAFHDHHSLCCSTTDCSHICTDPVDPITTVDPASWYVATFPCPNCTGKFREEEGRTRPNTPNGALFNITLSHDRMSLLLNNEAIFPFPSSFFGLPPSLYTYETSPAFDYGHLKAILDCPQQQHHKCFEYNSVSLISTDYDLGFGDKIIMNQDGKVQWVITYDPIGLKDPSRKMLRIVLHGQESGVQENIPGSQESSTLFGSSGRQHRTAYELEITGVELVQPTGTYPSPRQLGAWGKVKHFFGYDPVTPNHFVYIRDEWGFYGKEGTLKEMIGIFLFDWPWDLIGIIVGSVVGGLIALYGLYRLFLLGLKQKRLAQWRGMDEVWRQMRAGELEGDHLLRGEYRDDPEDGMPPPYSAELPINKPLPSLPLPDKPLPAVPLIDGV